MERTEERMVNGIDVGREFFAELEAEDERSARRVAAARCLICGGPLHRSDYDRKPRGALVAPAGEGFVRRFSLCCGREGCRRRSLPPSLRFLGRRVYLGAVVIVASMIAQSLVVASAMVRATGVHVRTTRRWLRWWRGPFTSTEVFIVISARLIGVSVDSVPASIVNRLGGRRRERVRAMLGLLGPISGKLVPDGSRVSRATV